MAKGHIDLGEVTAGIVCPKCGATEFQRETDDDDSQVTCKACGHDAGTYSEVRAAQLKAVKKRVVGDIKKSFGKGLKGFKKR